MKLALIGTGQRGRIYADYAVNKGGAEISALLDPHPERLRAAAAAYGVAAENCFEAEEEFFAGGKRADAALIASMDRDHCRQALAAMELGYEVLLEKPISPDLEECLQVRDTAVRLGRKVVVCHVLRYTNFFSAVKAILDSGELGKIMTIQHNENVGNFHMAHSFVRGNWRNSTLSSPMIVQKSCHDMDLLVWLTGSDAEEVSSFGSLRFFREENAPEHSAARCCACPAAAACRFAAERCYLPMRGGWPATMVSEDQTEAGLREALKTSPYGRCVYRCDNDVCDNQVTLIRFCDGTTATFNLSGFTNKMCRTMKIMCEQGEIRADDSLNRIEVTRFAANQAEEVEQRVLYPALVNAGHGGGDAGLMEDFLRLLRDGEGENRSSVACSVESHLMAFAAERSRLEGRTLRLDELRSGGKK